MHDLGMYANLISILLFCNGTPGTKMAMFVVTRRLTVSLVGLTGFMVN